MLTAKLQALHFHGSLCPHAASRQLRRDSGAGRTGQSRPGCNSHDPWWPWSLLSERISPLPVLAHCTLRQPKPWVQKPVTHSRHTDPHCFCLFLPASVIALQEGCVKWKVINQEGTRKRITSGHTTETIWPFHSCQRASSLLLAPNAALSSALNPSCFEKNKVSRFG